MKRWEFGSIDRASNFVFFWYKCNTSFDRSLLQDYLDCLCNIGFFNKIILFLAKFLKQGIFISKDYVCSSCKMDFEGNNFVFHFKRVISSTVGSH
jgi:hypothetical protein